MVSESDDTPASARTLLLRQALRGYGLRLNNAQAIELHREVEKLEGVKDELFAALEVCGELLENLHGRKILASGMLDSGHITLNLIDAVDDARAAITKAKGEGK